MSAVLDDQGRTRRRQVEACEDAQHHDVIDFTAFAHLNDCIALRERQLAIRVVVHVVQMHSGLVFGEPLRLASMLQLSPERLRPGIIEAALMLEFTDFRNRRIVAANQRKPQLRRLFVSPFDAGESHDGRKRETARNEREKDHREGNEDDQIAMREGSTARERERDRQGGG